MMKHAWRLLIDKESLWASTYKAKYFPNASIVDAPSKSNKS